MEAFCRWLAQAPVSTNQEEARLSCLDTFGCMLAGTAHPVTMAVRDCGLPVAALAGVAAHIHDFDDNELVASTHPSSVILAALCGLNSVEPLTYGRILDGYAAGFAAIRSVGTVMGYEHYAAGWHATTTIGVFGAAMACARALSLNEDQMCMALSFAIGRSAGLKAQFGTDAKAIQVGQAAEGGLQAALLAKAGLRGNATASWAGFIELHDGKTTQGTNSSSPSLEIQVGEISRKPWPCCQYSHRALDALSRLKVRPDDISKVRISAPDVFLRNVAIAVPQTPNEAKFSLVWCAAKLLMDGKLDLDSFTQSQLERTDLRRLAERIELVREKTAENIGDLNPAFPVKVTVDLEDGTQMQQTCAFVPGSAENPVSIDTLVKKFADCAAISGCGPVDPRLFLDRETDTPFNALIAEIGLADLLVR